MDYVINDEMEAYIEPNMLCMWHKPEISGGIWKGVWEKMILGSVLKDVWELALSASLHCQISGTHFHFLITFIS